MERSFTGYAKERIKEIHGLSKRYNGKDKDHSRVLLDLVKKHADEIEELYAKNDEHFVIETGDLAVLCLELFMEHGREPDEIMDTCYRRYTDKLTSLLDSCRKTGRMGNICPEKE